MAKDKNPAVFAVGDTVEWVVESDGEVWEVEVLAIEPYGVIVDSGYGKKAIFAPNSQDKSKHTLLVGSMEMGDYIRHPKKKNKKSKKNKKGQKAPTTVETPEVFTVGEWVEWVETDGTIWEVKVLEVRNYGVVVAYSWDKALFAPSAKKKGKHTRWINGVETGDYIRHPKNSKKKNK